MGITANVDEQGIAEVVVDAPPVNALTVAGWFELARTLNELGENRAVRVVVLRAEGRGFNAGVDIKEMQNTEGFDALIGANKGCFAAFAAVYDCPVPVIAAVHGFCVGGGVGLVGNADVIVASDDAYFGLPEVDRGALGAATHLSRLVPQHKMRAMVYTSATATAAELHAFGSVLKVVSRDELRDAAFEVAADHRREVAHGDPGGQGEPERHRPVGREALVPLRAGLHVRAQPGGRVRRAARRVRRGPRRRHVGIGGHARDMPDKRITEEDVVAELRDGMTIGIGGWGSRRKPMSLVRAIARSDLRDLTIVSYGGPDVGLLCATGKVKKVVYSFCSLDTIALEPHFRKAREAGTVSTLELDEGMFLLGLQAAAWRVPFLPTRVGLGSDVVERQDEIRTVVSPYDDGEVLVAAPALNLDVALVHMHRGDARGNGQYLNVDPYFDDLFCMAAPRAFMSVEQVVPTEDLASNGPVQTLKINRLMTHGVVEAPHGAHFTECVPDYERDEAFQREYALTARDPDAWTAWSAKYLDCGDHAEYRKVVGL